MPCNIGGINQHFLEDKHKYFFNILNFFRGPFTKIDEVFHCCNYFVLNFIRCHFSLYLV
jgi:hypothetical protein